jgi:DNA polymerase III sliding clamp (beta) subunit (PCNA family)
MRIDGKELFEAVTQVNRVISNRATLPVLSGIRLTQKSGGLEVAAPIISAAN